MNINKIMKKVAFSNNLVNALEVGGLGILAKPGFDTMRNPNATAEEKHHAKMENLGLGVLGVHPAYELGQSGIQKASPYLNNMHQDMLNSTSPMARRIGQGVESMGARLQGLKGSIGNTVSGIANKIKFK